MEESHKLLHYCAMGDTASVKRICLNPKIDLDAGDYDGRTPMHLAASEGHLDILK
jgi:ankyrin repeat protein